MWGRDFALNWCCAPIIFIFIFYKYESAINFIYRQNDTYIKAGVKNIVIWNTVLDSGRRWASIFICGVSTVSLQTFQTPFSIIFATCKQFAAIPAFLLLKLPWNMALAKLAIFWWEMLQKKIINNLCPQRQMLVQICYSIIDTFE